MKGSQEIKERLMKAMTRKEDDTVGLKQKRKEKLKLKNEGR